MKSGRWIWVLLDREWHMFPRHRIVRMRKSTDPNPYGGWKVVGEFDTKKEAEAMLALLT